MSCHFFVFKEVAGLSLQLLPIREESHSEQFTHAARSSEAQRGNNISWRVTV